jgi:hypothetical protein
MVNFYFFSIQCEILLIETFAEAFKYFFFIQIFFYFPANCKNKIVIMKIIIRGKIKLRQFQYQLVRCYRPKIKILVLVIEKSIFMEIVRLK